MFIGLGLVWKTGRGKTRGRWTFTTLMSCLAYSLSSFAMHVFAYVIPSGEGRCEISILRKPRSWLQGFINKALISVYDRTTFIAWGGLGRFTTRGPRRLVLRMNGATTLCGAICPITFVSSHLTRGQESVRQPSASVHNIPPPCGCM